MNSYIARKYISACDIINGPARVAINIVIIYVCIFTLLQNYIQCKLQYTKVIYIYIYICTEQIMAVNHIT